MANFSSAFVPWGGEPLECDSVATCTAAHHRADNSPWGMEQPGLQERLVTCTLFETGRYCACDPKWFLTGESCTVHFVPDRTSRTNAGDILVILLGVISTLFFTMTLMDLFTLMMSRKTFSKSTSNWLPVAAVATAMNMLTLCTWQMTRTLVFIDGPWMRNGIVIALDTLEAMSVGLFMTQLYILLPERQPYHGIVFGLVYTAIQVIGSVVVRIGTTAFYYFCVVIWFYQCNEAYCFTPLEIFAKVKLCIAVACIGGLISTLVPPSQTSTSIYLLEAALQATRLAIFLSCTVTVQMIEQRCENLRHNRWSRLPHLHKELERRRKSVHDPHLETEKTALDSYLGQGRRQSLTSEFLKSVSTKHGKPQVMKDESTNSLLV